MVVRTAIHSDCSPSTGVGRYRLIAGSGSYANEMLSNDQDRVAVLSGVRCLAGRVVKDLNIGMVRGYRGTYRRSERNRGLGSWLPITPDDGLRNVLVRSLSNVIPVALTSSSALKQRPKLPDALDVFQIEGSLDELRGGRSAEDGNH
jgi:hypothetical protein